MIAFFGMGLLGSNFVRALRRKGEEVAVWNRTFARAEALVHTGARPFANAADAVRGASRLHLTLKDDASVDEVLEAARPGFSAGLIIVDHTTTSVEGAARRSRLWAERGFGYLHAPVFMGPQNAHDSTGLMLASGDKALFDKVAVAVGAMCGTLKWVGAEPERAAGFKLMGNLLFLTVVGGLRDVLSLSKSLGYGSAEVTQLFQDLNAGAQVPLRLQRILTADHNDPSWELVMARKDAGLMVAEAEKAGFPLAVAPAIAAVMDQWIATGHGHDDWTVITKDVR
jgi:3-hydroxyisobutyrate dehydrogenase